MLGLAGVLVGTFLGRDLWLKLVCESKGPKKKEVLSSSGELTLEELISKV